MIVTNDDFLREHHFTISARPAIGKPIWDRGREHYTQNEALHIAHKEENKGLARLSKALVTGDAR